jgi:beta-glucosidase
LELKAWSKVALAPGQTRTVAFMLMAECFCFPNEKFESIVEQGAFDILVGLNADRKSLLTVRLYALAS